MYDYDKNLKTDLNEVVELFDKDYSHNELLKFLKTGTVVQKQVAALRLDNICSFDDAIVLVDNLVGQDGKIREAVSLKINEFKTSPYLHQKTIYDILLQAIIDINGNICRNIISAIEYLKNDNLFIEYFVPNLLNLTNALVEKVSQFNFQEGKYKVNKEVFKLYWCLETIYCLAEKININDLKNILGITKNINEYTIREKTAKILSKNLCSDELEKFRLELKTDSNYYVSRF